VHIKKLCRYSHNEYLHRYGYGYEMNIYPAGGIRWHP